MTKIMVLLSGCGKNDGSEIHESVLALLAITNNGAAYECCAPDGEQTDVMNHHSDEPMNEKRNMRVEAARIARGPVRDVKDVTPDQFDALVIPGGFGAAKNLCSFASEGPDCTVNDGVEALLKATHEAGKPIGAICIAPALVARVLGKGKLTIGNDKGTAEAINKTGSCHVDCDVGDIVIDETLNLVSTPAYMLGPGIVDVNKGISKLVAEVISRCKSKASTA